MSTTTSAEDGEQDAAGIPESIPAPPSKGRVLLYAIAPVLLLALLTAGIRFASEAASKRDKEADSKLRQELAGVRPGRTKGSLGFRKPLVITRADAATQSALETVVQGQLRAINDGDFAKALTFAIPEIQTNTNPLQFGETIRRGYSPMLAAKKVTIVSAQIQSGEDRRQAIVETHIHTTFDTTVTYMYLLTLSGKEWRVMGVTSRPERPPGEDGPPPSQRPDTTSDL